MTATLVLYDTTGTWGYLGELYAIGIANLCSHFGSVTAKPVASYAAGDIANPAYTATVYVGSTYDEPLPSAFLDDVLATTKPVVWINDNIWRLTARSPNFTTRFGWNWTGFDFSPVAQVQYKGTSLTRYVQPNPASEPGIMNVTISNPALATVLATAVRQSGGTTFPWATRSAQLTYIGENPLSFISEQNRVIAFSDLLFDALAPATATRHRALVRLEDVSPNSDLTQLRGCADYLASRNVPFGVGVIAQYLDPTGYYNYGVPDNFLLSADPAVADALRYCQSKGGVLIEHGYTHQWAGGPNYFSGVTGDDFEFYRVTQNPDFTLNYVGPLPEDSAAWANGRIDQANAQFTASGLAIPSIFEFPHYAASATDYRTIAARFSTRWERAIYYKGVLAGGTIDHARSFGQFFPYVVNDVYGTKVLPENLGNIEPEQFQIFPPRLPADIIASAQKNLVVRDGFASFFFHPFYFDTTNNYLQQTIAGIQGLGYTFVSPLSL